MNELNVIDSCSPVALRILCGNYGLPLDHERELYGSNAAATRRPSSASKLYVEHAFRCGAHRNSVLHM